MGQSTTSCIVEDAELILVIPNGSAWSCNVSCPTCLYLMVNVSTSDGLEGRLGYGIRLTSEDGHLEDVGTNLSTQSADRHGTMAAHNGSTMGMQLMPSGRFDQFQGAVSCTVDNCNMDEMVSAGFSGFAFDIFAPAAADGLDTSSLGSFYGPAYGGVYGPAYGHANAHQIAHQNVVYGAQYGTGYAQHYGQHFGQHFGQHYGVHYG